VLKQFIINASYFCGNHDIFLQSSLNIESSQVHLFEIEITICNNTCFFIVTFDQFNASLLNTFQKNAQMLTFGISLIFWSGPKFV